MIRERDRASGGVKQQVVEGAACRGKANGGRAAAKFLKSDET